MAPINKTVHMNLSLHHIVTLCIVKKNSYFIILLKAVDSLDYIMGLW
jgi:hypothetical protein